MITDLAEVARQGMEKSAENLQFRRYLAAHRQRIEDFQAIATKVQERIDCTQCANCCRQSIYPARPEAWRNFPHVAPGAHSLGSRLESHRRWAPLCPVLFNAFEEYKHLAGFRGGI